DASLRGHERTALANWQARLRHGGGGDRTCAPDRRLPRRSLGTTRQETIRTAPPKYVGVKGQAAEAIDDIRGASECTVAGGEGHTEPRHGESTYAIATHRRATHRPPKWCRAAGAIDQRDRDLAAPCGAEDGSGRARPDSPATHWSTRATPRPARTRA